MFSGHLLSSLNAIVSLDLVDGLLKSPLDSRETGTETKIEIEKSTLVEKV